MTHSVSIHVRCCLGAGILAALALQAAASEAGDNRLIYQTASCRKEEDTAWKVRIAGKVPSLAGCYLIVYNSKGERVLMKHIPSGDYSREQPLEFSVAKDGTQGDYQMVIIGHEHDVMGIQLPLTDLRKEVYGYSYFAKRVPQSVWFLSDPEVKEYEISSGRSSRLAVLHDGSPVLAPRSSVHNGREKTALAGALEPGHVYELQTTGTFYFQAKPGVYLAFDPSHCFLPDPALQKVAWWQLTENP